MKKTNPQKISSQFIITAGIVTTALVLEGNWKVLSLFGLFPLVWSVTTNSLNKIPLRIKDKERL